MRTIDAHERRIRLGRRHMLAPGHRARDAVTAATGVVCLHATDPATVYLSAWARTEGFAVEEMDRALYQERSLVKHLAMRRTLFVFPRNALPDGHAGASVRVAKAERKRLVKEVERAGLHRNGGKWLAAAEEAVLELLASGREATSSELRAELPLLDGSITYGEGKTWGGKVPVGPRVLTILGASGKVVRASNDGGWTSSRPRWAATRAWLGEEIGPREEAEGVKGLVRRWLERFGPGTEADINWWLGGTLKGVRAALAGLDAVEVELGDGVGYVLPGDEEPVGPVEPWAALLPPLDPTTMGWFQRDWYLGEHKAQIFDRNGNGGATAWWDGRIVGGWRPASGDGIELQLLEDVGSEAVRALEAEAHRLTTWLGGTGFQPRFPSPLSKA